MSIIWTEDATIPEKARAVKAVCTTGTEAAPAQNASSGLLMRGILGFTVFLESTAAAFTAATLECYVQNPVNGKWDRRPEWDESVLANTSHAFSRTVDERTNVGRVVFVPNGLGQANEIHIVGNYKG
jgi:hypothetical protein